MSYPATTETAEERRRRIETAVRQDPTRMTLLLARDLGVPEVEIVRALPDGRAVELDRGRWEELFRALENLGDVHVIVSNGAATLEAVGRFGGFSITGEFFNVQTKSLDMHLRYRELAAVFAVEKPSHMDSGAPAARRTNALSFQFFDRAGAAALKVFIHFAGTPRPEREARFAELRERFRKP
jgi:putative hemin transport protein